MVRFLSQNNHLNLNYLRNATKSGIILANFAIYFDFFSDINSYDPSSYVQNIIPFDDMLGF